MNVTCFVCLKRYDSGVLLRFAATFLTGTTIFLGSAFLLFRHLEITLMLELLFDLFLHIIGLLHMWLTEVSLESLLALPWLLMLFGLHLDGPFVYIIVGPEIKKNCYRDLRFKTSGYIANKCFYLFYPIRCRIHPFLTWHTLYVFNLNWKLQFSFSFRGERGFWGLLGGQKNI